MPAESGRPRGMAEVVGAPDEPTAPGGRRPCPPAPSEARRRGAEVGAILIVDDHEDNIEVLRVRLESWGYGTDALLQRRRRARVRREVPARPRPPRRDDAGDRRHRGRPADQGEQGAALHPDHHADGARLHRGQGRGARGGRGRLHHQADRLRRAQGAAALHAAHQAPAGGARGAREGAARGERAAALHVADGRPHGARQPPAPRTSGIDEMFQHAQRLNEPFSLRDVRPGQVQERERHLRASGG